MIAWFPIMPKMHNLQTTETPKNAKKQFRARTKLSVNARMQKTSTSHLTS